jgi:hypothetical protein
VQDVAAHLAHELGARIEVLVDAVAEAHQLEGVVLVLGARNVLADARDVVDFLEHLQAGLVGTTVRRAPEAGDAGRDAGVGVGAGRTGQTHRRGRGILFVVGVQREDGIQRMHQHRVRLYFSHGLWRTSCA